MRDREAFSYAFFVVTFLMAVFSTVHSTEYISLAARAVVLPMFLISILEFLSRIKEDTLRILEMQRKNHTSNLKMWEPYYKLAKESVLLNEENRDAQKCINDYQEEEVNLVYVYNVSDQVEKLYKWYVPSYVLAIAFLIFAIIFAHEKTFIAIFSCISSDAITLWTLALFLLNMISVKFFSHKLRKYAESKVNREDIANRMRKAADM